MAKERKEVRLGDVAETFRCQLPRKRLTVADLASASWKAGVYPGRRAVAREAGLDQIDPETGFLLDGQVLPSGMPLFRLSMGRLGEKYLLRQGDILWVALAGMRSLARCGFVARDTDPVFPARTFFVIRATGCDPVWLFHQLREQWVRDEMLGRLAASKVLNITIESLRDLTLTLPPDDVVEAVRNEHDQVVQSFFEIERMKKESFARMASIHTTLQIERDLDLAVERNATACRDPWRIPEMRG